MGSEPEIFNTSESMLMFTDMVRLSDYEALQKAFDACHAESVNRWRALISIDAQLCAALDKLSEARELADRMEARAKMWGEAVYDHGIGWANELRTILGDNDA